MYGVHREHYLQHHGLGENDPVPLVEIWPSLTSIQPEINKPDELCFAWTAAKFYRWEIKVDEYFDRLIAHLEEGAARHTFDNAESTKLEHLLRVDPIGGAVKRLMLDESFPRLQPAEAAKLKKLCVAAYSEKDPGMFGQEVAAADADLQQLPPQWLDILAVTAYTRRHVSVFQEIVTQHRGPSPKSTFDHFGTMLISGRLKPSRALKHSLRDSDDNRIEEIRLWTALLQADGWIHYPLSDSGGGPWGLYPGLHWLIDFWEREPQLRASPEVEALCRLFGEKGIVIGVPTLSRFLHVIDVDSGKFSAGVSPCGLGPATMVLSVFPRSRIASEGSIPIPPGQSANLLRPLTQWDDASEDRLQVARMALEQGYDINEQLNDHGSPSSLTARQRDSALHLAAERGDGPLVDLLLEFGARGDVRGGGGEEDTPVQRARVHGHADIAARIEAVTSQELKGGVGSGNRTVQKRDDLCFDSGIDDEPETEDFFG